MYFVRDYKGFEVDLLVESGRKVDLYEIKSSVSFHGSFADNISRLASIMDNVGRKTVVYSGQPASSQGVEFVNYASVGRVFSEAYKGDMAAGKTAKTPIENSGK